MIGPMKVFDTETWCWRDATAEELRKQEAADALRYPEYKPTGQSWAQEVVTADGRKFLIIDRSGKMDANDPDLIDYITNSGGDCDGGSSACNF